MSLSYYLLLSAILFSIGVYGVLAKRHAIIILMSIEIMLNAANLNLVAFSAYSATLSGQVLALFSIAIAAAEAAVGLAIFLLVFRTHGTIEVQNLRILKW